MEFAERWLTVEQIAEHLQVSKETIYRWLDRKRIPAHRIGRQWRFQATEVDEWVRQGEATENPRPTSEEISKPTSAPPGSQKDCDL